MLDLINEIAGFFYSVFTGLGDYATQPLSAVLDGYAGVYTNPFTDYQFVFLAPPTGIVGDILEGILNLFPAFNASSLSVLEFVVGGVVSTLAIIAIIRFVKFFT